jgi:hypothetical protein
VGEDLSEGKRTELVMALDHLLEQFKILEPNTLRRLLIVSCGERSVRLIKGKAGPAVIAFRSEWDEGERVLILVKDLEHRQPVLPLGTELLSQKDSCLESLAEQEQGTAHAVQPTLQRGLFLLQGAEDLLFGGEIIL